MRPIAVVALSLVATGCERTAEPANQAKVEHRQTVQPFREFVDELCGTWAAVSREDRPAMLDYYQKLSELGARREKLDFAHQVLGDRLLYKCWPTASELIGLSGSESAALPLLEGLMALRPGAWEFHNYHEAVMTGSYLAMAHRGLAWAVARLGEGHPLSTRILDHLEACAELDYWYGDKSPRLLAEWYPGVNDMQSVHDSQAFWQAYECISALGYTGSSRATSYLTLQHARFAQQSSGLWSEWRGGDGSITLFVDPIQSSVDVRMLGVDQYIERNAGSF